MSDDMAEYSFTATGPPHSHPDEGVPGVPFTAFSTRATGMVYGANVQGDRAGIYAESVRAPTERESDVDGVGLNGVGDNFGVFGRTFPSPGRPGIAGVYAQHNRGGIGAIGAVMRGGTGLAGVSVGSLGNPLMTFAQLPDPGDGDGTGVFGTSGSGPGVRGTSDSGAGGAFEAGTGPGVEGKSRSDRGGVFESGSVGLTPQLRLVPQPMPVTGTLPARPVVYDRRVLDSLPQSGKGGDLLVTQSDDGECALWFCTRDQQADRPATWSQVLLAPPAVPPGVAEIGWPQRVMSSIGGGGPHQDPQAVVGPPDGVIYLINPDLSPTDPGHMGATFSDFSGQAYGELEQVLGPGHVIAGDSPTAADLARTDVIAFERNGPGPAPSGGWEGCDFSFSDGSTTVTVPWSGALGAPRDSHVIANGSIRGADYTAYFNIAPGMVPDDEFISFLLFALPELSTVEPAFTVAVNFRAPEDGDQATPDVDAIGVVRR